MFSLVSCGGSNESTEVYIKELSEHDTLKIQNMKLKANPGETTEDGKFSIEETRCAGSCGLAPVFTVNGEVYGKATVQKLDQVLDELMKMEH